MEKLTICTVSFHSSRFLELNRYLISRLNSPDDLPEWLVVENTPAEGRHRGMYAKGDFTMINGVPPPDLPLKVRGSYHHGIALNKAVRLSRTPYILILDPDFYIIRPNWIPDVLDYMDAKRLAFFGVPWHPRLYRKYRYFPCVHCMFIDLRRVDKRYLDFRPDLLKNPASVMPVFWERFARYEKEGRWRKAIKISVRSPLPAIKEDWALRKLIMSSRDTGVRVYRRYRKAKKIRWETVQPVFAPLQDEFEPFGISRFQRQWLVESLIPDAKRYVPRKKKYYVTDGFKNYGVIDTTQFGWEEFLWRDNIFGFHVRHYLNYDDGKLVEYDKLKDVIDNVVRPH